MMPVVLVLTAAVALLGLAVQWRRAAFLRSDLNANDRMLKVIEERLEHARDDIFRLTAALDDVPQGVVLCDPDGNEIVRNRTAGAYVGARHGEALVEQAIFEELRAALRGARRQRNLDLFGPPKRLLSITASPLREGGAVAVIDDVSERRRLDAIRRDFVANISHELKTPVGALGVLADAISDADDREVVRRLADRMTGEAVRAGRIIDDLLALTRIESEETTSRDHVRIGNVVNEAVQRMGPLAEARRIGVACEEVGAGHAVVGDRRQLISAVANLIENACKYSEEGSGVIVRSRMDGPWIELDVEDRGIGIPSTDLDRVFERFYRVDRARSRETGGTGLGLAIVRHVATNHGGDVRVTSTEGVGSTFTLRLPIGTVDESFAS